MSLVKRTDPNALAELDELFIKFGENMVYDVSDVIGVLTGLKPAALIGNNGKVPNIEIDLIERLGLKCVSWPAKNLTYVSYNQEQADRLAELHQVVWGANANHPDENREIGVLLGYPQSATEYFLERLLSLGTETPLPQFVPEEIKGTVSEYFCELILSPEHYKEEMKAYCQPMEAAVREFAPRTYEALCALSSRS